MVIDLVIEMDLQKMMEKVRDSYSVKHLEKQMGIGMEKDLMREKGLVNY